MCSVPPAAVAVSSGSSSSLPDNSSVNVFIPPVIPEIPAEDVHISPSTDTRTAEDKMQKFRHILENSGVKEQEKL